MPKLYTRPKVGIPPAGVSALNSIKIGFKKIAERLKNAPGSNRYKNRKGR